MNRNSRVLHITSEDQFNNLLQHRCLIVIDFMASWCGPCKAMAPHIDKLANEYKNIMFAKIDVDELPELATSMHIQSMPTVIIVYQGIEKNRIVGNNIPQLIQTISLYL